MGPGRGGWIGHPRVWWWKLKCQQHIVNATEEWQKDCVNEEKDAALNWVMNTSGDRTTIYFDFVYINYIGVRKGFQWAFNGQKNAGKVVPTTSCDL